MTSSEPCSRFDCPHEFHESAALSCYQIVIDFGFLHTMQSVDSSGDGEIDYSELLEAVELEPLLLDAIAAVLPQPPTATKVVALLRERTNFDW
eukprot:SAG11_NODE_147_length_14771_cov_3.279648_13_plen_93_part_00